MFDGRLERWVSGWRDNWDSSDPAYIFRQAVCYKEYPEADGHEMGIGCRDQHGAYKEFLRTSRQVWDRAVRMPVQVSRLGNNTARTFFVYHWMEEQNKLESFINFVKETRNA